MSTVEIERFAADVTSNAALRAEAEKAYAQGQGSHATPVAAMAAFAAVRGYGFTADELGGHAKAAGRKVDDAELDGVTGGAQMFGGFASMFGALFGKPL